MPRQIKAALFLALWHEMAAQFALGVDAAFLASAAIFWGNAWLKRTALEFAGLSEPLTASFVWGGSIWLLVYLWLAPAFVRELPLSFIAGAIALLVLAGFQARQQSGQGAEKFGKAWFRDRSEAVVIAVLGTLVATFLARQHWGSALPLAGYVALFGLPFSFGWMGAGLRARTRHDARFGDEKMFRDAGVSDDY